MIQRIQTLYMSLSAFACLLLLFFPVAGYLNETRGTYEFYLTGMRYLGDPPTIVNFWLTFPLLLMVAGSILLLVIAIFLYRRRNIQLWLVNISFLFHAALIILLFIYYINHFGSLFNANPQYHPWIFVPIVSLIFIVLASRAIRKDEALVKSSDRLR